MKRLLKVYLLNIFKQKGFYICLAIDVVISVLIGIISSKVSHDTTTTIASQLPSVFTVSIVPTIFITLFVCSDYTDGATKNFIARGYTRRQLLLGKYFAVLIALLVWFLVEALVVIIGYAPNGFGFDNTFVILLIGYIMASIAGAGFFVITSNTLEKVSLALTVNMLVSSFIPIIATILIATLKINFDIQAYWVTTLGALLPEKNAGIMDLVKITALSLGYLVLLFELSNVIIKRKEVK